MKTNDHSKIKGHYTANLIGNIRSHLAGLQGYDVMALELIQNADDAKAEEIIFDITDTGLLVLNSGLFTFCGGLEKRPCDFLESHGYACDYHRIVDVGSGGKLSKGENIGRFGIGFVSTYQITDHPEVRSAELKLILYPELGKWEIESYHEPFGTSFFLPWAKDPNTQARQALGVSHVTSSHIDQLTDDFLRVLRESLLFLRHVRKAEVRRNGKLLLSCDLYRNEQSELRVSFKPNDEVELWHIIRSDASENAARLYEENPYLEKLNRSTKISIGLRLKPKPLKEGLLYAFLPTEQFSGLPLHINADFFPEADRKSVIFTGHQYQQAWNEMLINRAAIELANAPEALLEILGYNQFWEIYSRAFVLQSETNEYPCCFDEFWKKLKSTGSKSCIVMTEDNSFHHPDGVFVPRRGPLDANQAEILLKIGGKIVSKELWPFQSVINQLGSQYLTLERLIPLLNSAMGQHIPGESQIEAEQQDCFYMPLWSIINELIPEKTINSQSVRQLCKVPFLITEDLYIVTTDQSHLVPKAIDAKRVTELLPSMAIISEVVLAKFTKIIDLVAPLELGPIVSNITSSLKSESIEEAISTESEDLKDLYSLFADIDRLSKTEDNVYEDLRDLPIWKTGQGFCKANYAFLPGNFKDPTGYADLFDLSVINNQVKDFLLNKLGVQRQTIESFVQTVLPRFFDENGPKDENKYSLLMVELAKHSAIINDNKIMQFLGSFPIVPTQDGNWSYPSVTYRRSEKLFKVLGDALHLWVDNNRIPDKRSARILIDNLGIQKFPLPTHLAHRIITIAKNSLPTEDEKNSSSEAFYVLCDYYDDWRDENDFQNALKDLKDAECFPAQGDNKNWFEPDSLYAPNRAEAFHSQAHILDFSNTQRLNRKLLKKLGISIEPETILVINHLKLCMAENTQPHYFTYQILNERAQKEESLISTLTDERCIYVESQKKFVRPNQVYWFPQQLGRYAFSIPNKFELFKPLFNALGVKNAPEGKDFADILLDIVGIYFEQSKSITGTDRSVYDKCFSNVSISYESDELNHEDLKRLQEAPVILNLNGEPTHPDEVLLQDSEWHLVFFDGELEQALCSYPPEQIDFIEQLGVRRLTEAAKVNLAFIDGEEIEESEVAESILQRMSILKRLLHDKKRDVKTKVEDGLYGLNALSCEKLNIQASVYIGEEEVSAPEVSTPAYYDIEKKQLILSRPIGKRCWPHIFNSILHQLMPEETGSEISKFTLILRPLMDLTVEEGHRELTDAGIPELETQTVDIDLDELESPDLDEIGSESVSIEDESIGNELNPKESEIDKQTNEPIAPKNDDDENMGRVKKVQLEDSKTETLHESETDDKLNPQAKSIFRSKQGSSTNKESANLHQRPKHKKQWDRRLLSYVRKLSDDDAKDNENTSKREYNLRIEALSRDAVCAYEKKCGRVPTQMAQTNPGYDVTSTNPLTDEKRFIEVKGVNGEWNVTGVGLSKLQFNNAQDFGDEYWLYVVEFVSDAENKRIHPIQNPANKVTSFMFDGNWRDAVSEEGEDPALAFIPGAKVQHTSFGHGRIQSVEKKGESRMMFIDFDDYGRKPVTLNLQTMSVIEEDLDYDYTESN
jgi:hypothetical protein